MAKVILRKASKRKVSEIEVGCGYRYTGVLYQVVVFNRVRCVMRCDDGVVTDKYDSDLKVTPMDITITARPLIRE